ncbi:MAG: 3-phosphoserine/phosphohydroxythreonine transaminase [Halieaceae bacterium]|nr:3-phosphoserine/phosphohydroxythreonine transaminase [Halieaceae bacterium]
MSRCYNFSPGPAALPEAVLRQASAELLDWGGSGMSVMEMSHRSAEFNGIAVEAEACLRRLLDLSADYAVLFMHGGATTQFSAVPLNLGFPAGQADYVNTGHWSSKAIAEAGRYLEVNVVATSVEENFSTIPPQKTWSLNDNAAYLHHTPNETIGGVEFFWVPEVEVPLVADMSSTLLSRPVDIHRFGVVYASAQKNIGPAGLTLVLVHRELLGRAAAATPSLLNWKITADHQSMFNTPPTYALYLTGLVLAWLEARGGLEAIEAVNRRKAEKLYRMIDDCDFYSNPVAEHCRSLMNIPFTLADDALDKIFLAQAREAGLLNLKGHRSVGGMRASLYNAISEQAVDVLIDFMRDFAASRG